MKHEYPPAWAERLLRLLLAPRDRETVSGDFLELYRDGRSDWWYVVEVARLAWLQNWPWAALLALSMIARTAADWFLPTHDFHARANWTTSVNAGVILLAGVVAAWRVRSVAAGAVAGFATVVAAAILHAVVTTEILAVWHSPETLIAIQGSGGLAEALTLPMMLCIPGIILGAAGGSIVKVLRRTAGQRQHFIH